ISTGGDLWGLDTELKEPVRLTESVSHERSPVLSVDGKAIYTVAKREGQVDIWKIERLQEDRYWWQPNEYRWTKITDDPNVEADLKVSPDGKHLYYVRDLGDLYRRALADDGNVVKLATGFSPPDYDISPCG